MNLARSLGRLWGTKSVTTPSRWIVRSENKFTKPPTMFRINGCGMTVCGKRDFDPQTNTYVKTLVFTLAFIPVFCWAAYRVADAPGTRGWFSWRDGWYFIQRVPLSQLARRFNWAVAAAAIGLTLLGLAGY